MGDAKYPVGLASGPPHSADGIGIVVGTVVGSVVGSVVGGAVVVGAGVVVGG